MYWREMPADGSGPTGDSGGSRIECERNLAGRQIMRGKGGDVDHGGGE